MASWVDVYDKIRFEVREGSDAWILWRVRYLRGKEVFKTFTRASDDKVFLENIACQYQRASALINSFYR